MIDVNLCTILKSQHIVAYIKYRTNTSELKTEEKDHF